MAQRPKVALILQARMGSTRLPGKSMMDLAGEPLVGRILERVKRCSSVDDIILAIPDTKLNKPLEKLGLDHGVNVFLGSENDVVERFFQASLEHKAEIIVRIPADNTTPQPEEVDRIIEHHLTLGRPGFSSNLSVIDNSGYPDGIGAEVFDFVMLKDARNFNLEPMKREHVHLNFYDYDSGKAIDPKWCPISTVKCPQVFRRPELILDVNTIEQYIFMKELYEALYPANPEFSIVDIIEWYDNIYDGPIKFSAI
jgi:spore coat polysaccharide biosynthesis protein SpsF